MKKKNPLENTRIEFHILQSLSVNCVNRDDVGSPKTAMVGGTLRARVSSQCWKREVRSEMKNLGVVHGNRTKLISLLIKRACIDAGATPEQASICGKKIAGIFISNEEQKSSTKKEKLKEAESEIEKEEEEEEIKNKDNDTLIFLSPREVNCIASAFKTHNFEPDLVIKEKKDTKKQAKELERLISFDRHPMDAADIALFGRMVAKANSMNVEAAVSFSHAISTHRVTNEIDFFTALDDLSDGISGAAHIGNLEFNSSTYYRYVSLDLGQLWRTLGGLDFCFIVEGFIKSLFLAVPKGRQNTLSAASPWDFAKIFIRKGQRLQVPFETAVKQKDGGFLESSIVFLKGYLEKKEKLAGSLFCKEAEYILGEDENFNIDDLLKAITDYINNFVSEK